MVDARVHVLDRGQLRADSNYLLEAHNLSTASTPNPDAVRGAGPVYNLVIEHPEATVLWDTGCHPEAKRRWPEAIADAFEPIGVDEHALDVELDRAGFAMGDVDAVIMSHLHLDHAGGLQHFEGRDVPVYVHAEELKHAFYCAKTGDGDDAYLAEEFDGDLDWRPVTRRRTTPFADLELLHLPGHTPGLLGMRLDLGGDSYLFTGDQAYVRANYDEDVPLGPTLLWDRPSWRASQRWLKELERRHHATVVCGHDPDDVDRLRDGLP
ncbi:MAG: N-acyl homoserine lactonase family protein [Halobacteriales archaeon]|nr:N-acyl homoserine lactonase family protein [Halobacteriales archaeon]